MNSSEQNLINELLARLAAYETRLAHLEAKFTPAPAAPASAKAVESSSSSDTIPWALIGAVVAYTFPAGARIHSVVPVAPPKPEWWAIDGRRNIMSSHKVR